MTPILEGPDGYDHYKYIRHLIVDRQFPALNDPDALSSPGHEAAQFPLYYLLGAAISFPVSTADFDQVAAMNPHAGDQRGNGNNNILYHKPFTGFPHGTELAARLVEIFSLACGAVTVACAVLLCRLAAPGRPWLWAAAGTVLAADPAFDANSAFVSNDNLVTALSAVTVLLLAYWVQERSAKWGWLSALTLSLAILAKFNAIGLLIPYGIALLLVERKWKARLISAGRLSLLFAAVDGWWLLRNQLMYGDFTAMFALNKRLVGNSYKPFAMPLADGVRRVLHEIPATLHGLFSTGAYSVDSPAYLYAITTALGVVGLASGAIVAARNMPKRPWLSIVLAWPVVIFLELLPYIYIAAGAARLLFPAITCLALLVVLGWAALLQRIRLPAAGGVLACLGLAVALIIPKQVIVPAFAYPPTLTGLPATATRVHATFDNAVELIGAESSGTGDVKPGVPVHLTLYWQLKKPVSDQLDTFVHVDSMDPGYIAGASFDGAVGGGKYPPSFWKLGQIVVDRYTFTLRPDKRPDKRNAIVLVVRAGMYQAVPGEPGIHKVPADPPEAGDRGLDVALWKIAGQPEPPVTTPAMATFASGLDLLNAKAVTVGSSSLDVSLRWKAAEKPAANFTVFVQLLSPDGRILAQHDSYPLDGRYPTTQWASGEQVFDEVRLPLSAPLLPQDRVIVGMYVLPRAQPILTGSGATFVQVPITKN